MIYDAPSLEKLVEVSPVLKRKVLAAMDALALKGVYFRVAQGWRTYQEQEGLYKLGRTVLTKPDGTHQSVVTNAHGGYSNHNFAMAVDCYPFIQGQSGPLEMQNPHSPNFLAMVAALKAQGLVWGGDWQSIKDYPHFQLANVPVTPTSQDRINYAQGGLTKVWESYGVNV